jgi:Putative prokaryotic signal transducing protein
MADRLIQEGLVILALLTLRLARGFLAGETRVSCRFGAGILHGVLSMDANEPAVVYTTNNTSDAEILKNVLEGEGIECELDGENQGGFVGVLDVKILVRASDEERARRVLASHAHNHGLHPGKHRGD